MVYLPPSLSGGWDLTAGVMVLRPWALVALEMNCSRMVNGNSPCLDLPGS